MSGKKFEGKGSAAVVGSADLRAGANDDFWKDNFYFGIRYNYRGRLVEHEFDIELNVDAIVFSGRDFTLVTGFENIPTSTSLVFNGGRWADQIGFSGRKTDMLVMDLPNGINDCEIERYDRNANADTQKLQVKALRLPEDPKEFVGCVLKDFDQENADLLLRYNEFYEFKLYYLGAEREQWSEALDLNNILSVSCPSYESYFVDLVVRGELVEDQSGQSSMEGFPLEKMNSEGNFIRMRYKDVNKLHHGEADVTLGLSHGALLKLSVVTVK